MLAGMTMISGFDGEHCERPGQRTVDDDEMVVVKDGMETLIRP